MIINIVKLELRSHQRLINKDPYLKRLRQRSKPNSLKTKTLILVIYKSNTFSNINQTFIKKNTNLFCNNKKYYYYNLI